MNLPAAKSRRMPLYFVIKIQAGWIQVECTSCILAGPDFKCEKFSAGVTSMEINGLLSGLFKTQVEAELPDEPAMRSSLLVDVTSYQLILRIRSRVLARHVVSDGVSRTRSGPPCPAERPRWQRR